MRRSLRKCAVVFGCVLAVLMPAHLHADDDFDFEDEGSCMAPYGSYYYGYLYKTETSGALTKIGNVTVREARGGKTMPSRLTFTVDPYATKSAIAKYVVKNVAIPAPFAGVGDNGVTISGVATWEYLIATLSDGSTIKASSKGVQYADSVTADALTDIMGDWGVVFAPLSASGSAADLIKNGFCFATVNIKAKGKATVNFYSTDLWGVKVTGTLKQVGTAYQLPITLKRSLNGGLETFSFTLVWNGLYSSLGLSRSSALSVQNVSALACNGKKGTFSIPMQCVAAGTRTWTKSEFNAATRRVVPPTGATSTTISSLSYNTTTGYITGKAKASYKVSGSTKSASLTLRALEVNGEAWGSIYFKTLGSGWLKVER